MCIRCTIPECELSLHAWMGEEPRRRCIETLGRNMNIYAASKFAIAAALATQAAALHAQEAVPQESTGEESAEDVGGLADIVVTATRRAQNLQDVPVSVQAVTAAALTSSGITGTDAIATITPG